MTRTDLHQHNSVPHTGRDRIKSEPNFAIQNGIIDIPFIFSVVMFQLYYF